MQYTYVNAVKCSLTRLLRQAERVIYQPSSSHSKAIGMCYLFYEDIVYLFCFLLDKFI